ncbi:spore germination protein GerPE [Pseudalkalibacillus sp. SCS-8]|uniref:spore germination protein GerPE n=1 Tax=Pseudalkalibacillus nanhaiensis TaxID=3115291 RepID=UPI0032DB31D9
MDRTSIVQTMEIVSLVSASIVQIGDARLLTPSSKALAVQRQESTYDPGEHEFEMYPMFTAPFPPFQYECIPVNTIQEIPAIHVKSINIIGVAASSVVRVGKTDYVCSEARVKHIRQFTIDPYE